MQVMNEDVDKKEHSEHCPRLKVGAAFPRRTIEAEGNSEWEEQNL